MTKHWQRLVFSVAQQDCELYCDLLNNAGALSITLEDAGDQPIYEPLPGETPHWNQTKVVGLFDTNANVNQIIQKLTNTLAHEKLADWQYEPLEDKEWTTEWTKDFHPIQFSNNLWICPSWCQTPDSDAINIYMDPGLAFGSGTHATTALCMKWLAQNNLRELLVVDYGCGSGILAITAAKLGAKKVWAIDNDDQALIATNNNADKNRVNDKISVGLPEKYPKLSADLLIANILALPLQTLAEQFANIVNQNGFIVLSGILKDQAALISQIYGQWFKMESSQIDGDWALLAGRRK